MKSITLKNTTKVTKEDFYACPRCDINSGTKGRLCPCPRGGCEAIVVAEKIVTKTTMYEPLKPKGKGAVAAEKEFDIKLKKC